MALDGFSEMTFTSGPTSWTVYRRGSGPGVLILHEIPGITPEVARFARRVADAGFSVALPHLFGTIPTHYGPGPLARTTLQACISWEFSVLRRGRRSRITDQLRSLARALHAEVGGSGVGAIGMCLTGNFALSLVLDAPVVAPVLSQPSLPFGLTRAHRADPHLEPGELEAVAQRCRDEDLRVLGLRFTHDLLSPPERFETLSSALGDRFEAVEIDSGPTNPWGLTRMAHSVVTRDLVDEEGHPTRAALDRVLAFFAERLREGEGTTPSQDDRLTPG
jgi:dienelactone hydrolase